MAAGIALKRKGRPSKDYQKKKYRNYGECLHRYPNLLNRDFKADRANQKWVADISYIRPEQNRT